MSNFEEKYEFAGKSKSASFNRSITLHAGAAPKPYHPPALDRSGTVKKIDDLADDTIKGKVQKLRSMFEAHKDANSGRDDSLARLKSMKSMGQERAPSVPRRSSTIRLPGTEDRIVVFLTSLHGIRRTYDDCYAVRMIFRGFRVWVDERDISMDSAYKKELQSVLQMKNVSLPQVFIKGRYIGGAEVVKQLFETSELGKLLEGLPVRKPGVVCNGCGDIRFVPCQNCSGSRKIFDEDEGLLKRCFVCNENGLNRCPDCCS